MTKNPQAEAKQPTAALAVLPPPTKYYDAVFKHLAVNPRAVRRRGSHA